MLALVRGRGVKVRIRQVPARKDPMPNGWYQAREICIYARDRMAQASAISSLLIHEYGHFLAELAGDCGASEAQVWELGRRAIPSTLLPNQFDIVRKFCLT